MLVRRGIPQFEERFMRPTFVRAGFVLCSSLSLTGCSGITGTDGAGEASYFGYRAASCAASASPLPGFRTCSVIAAITITKALPSGTVSVYFNYPDGGSFYHGEVSGLAGFTGTKEVTLTNSYVSSCPSLRTTVDVYDGPQSSQNSKMLKSQADVVVGPLC